MMMKTIKLRQKMKMNGRLLMGLLFIILNYPLAFCKQENTLTVTGTVTDAMEGTPIIGATVVEKGTTHGTITDINGNYAIDVEEGTVLSFSYVGYLTEEVTVGANPTIDVNMAIDILGLDEVVVVGYGTQRRSDLTGVVSSVKSEDIKKVASTSAAEALQGRAAGVMVNRETGRPGSEAVIHVRGVGSINDTRPLWIVDGVRMNPGTTLNMNDIESVEILKDASAASIYGAEAAHGVILVTTKKGETGKSKVSFSSYVGARTPIQLPDMLTANQFAQMVTESRINAGLAPLPFYDSTFTESTNWKDELFRTALVQNYDLSISGGTEKSRYYIAGGYYKEEGTVIDNYFQRLNLRINTDHTIGKRITIGENILLARTLENPIQDNAVIKSLYRANPMMPVYDPTNILGGGYGHAQDDRSDQFQGANPVAAENLDESQIINDRLYGNLFADIKLLKNLTFRTNLAADVNLNQDERFKYPFYHGPVHFDERNWLIIENRTHKSYTANMILTYQNSFGKHDLKAMAGYEAFAYDQFRFKEEGKDFISNESRVVDLTNPDFKYTEDSRDRETLLSQFGRLNYAYDNKYLLTASIRRDGSSKFGPNYRYGIFPSVSAGWRISHETFMEAVPLISDLKIRGSWGILGSDDIPNYQAQRVYVNNAYYTFGETETAYNGYYVDRFPNEDVRWEEIHQIDIGIDVSFFENQLAFTADYYQKNTVDMLISLNLPNTAGFSERNNSYTKSTNYNIGEIMNKGTEFTLTFRKYSGSFSYDISANAAFNTNEVLKLNEDQYIGGRSRTEAGHPVASFYGYVVEGIFQTQEEIEALNQYDVPVLDEDGNPVYNSKGELRTEDIFYQKMFTAPGDLKFKDLNEDGVINEEDMDFIGNPWPKLIYGLNANLRYKSFDMNFFVQGVQGVDLYNETKKFSESLFSDYNSTTKLLDYWRPDNTDTDIPRLVHGDPNENFGLYSSYFVEDGSYLRLKNVQIGYTLPESLTGWFGGSLRIYASALNVFTITGYSGLDPEFDTNSGNNEQKGVDFNTNYPQNKSYTFGLQLDF